MYIINIIGFGVGVSIINKHCVLLELIQKEAYIITTTYVVLFMNQTQQGTHIFLKLQFLTMGVIEGEGVYMLFLKTITYRGTVAFS